MPVLADTALPFDDQDTFESGWRAMARTWLPSGPLITGLAVGDWDVLRPSAGTGRQVLVSPGSVWIVGHIGEWLTQSALDISTNSSGQTRVDAIVAHCDFVENTIDLRVVEGTPGAGLPSLTQTSAKWETLLGSSTILNGGTSVTVAPLGRPTGHGPGGVPVMPQGTVSRTMPYASTADFTGGTITDPWRYMTGGNEFTVPSGCGGMHLITAMTEVGGGGITSASCTTYVQLDFTGGGFTQTRKGAPSDSGTGSGFTSSVSMVVHLDAGSKFRIADVIPLAAGNKQIRLDWVNLGARESLVGPL